MIIGTGKKIKAPILQRQDEALVTTHQY